MLAAQAQPVVGRLRLTPNEAGISSVIVGLNAGQSSAWMRIGRRGPNAASRRAARCRVVDNAGIAFA